VTYFQDVRWMAVAACIVAAAVLAWRKTPGWGWFLFVGFIAAITNA